MERVSSVKLLGFAVLAILLMFMRTTTADHPVLGRTATTTSEETPVRYGIVVEEMVMMQPIIETRNWNRKMIIRQPNIRVNSEAQNKQDVVVSTTTENVLKCVGLEKICNIRRGPSCCSGYTCFLPPSSTTGFCVEE
ncbi:uncharacterized protein LOC110704899 [Chenopodium quinoa]|uniref:uncharacterized protein LOC110704899 n=1 Tax=Chenopodium quinoa TaxID=63459 RepID=UPI000B77E6C9|nr:uncharacterized protein LOC110704899 [Chenopodium quinoa]